jgi:hypothetical protein
VSSTPLLGKVPGLYRELVPQPGDVLTHATGYATLQGGRFLFRGETEHAVTDAMRAVQAGYRLVTVPVAHVLVAAS